MFTSAKLLAGTIASYFVGKRHAHHLPVFVVFTQFKYDCSLSSCLRMLLSALHFAAFWCVPYIVSPSLYICIYLLLFFHVRFCFLCFSFSCFSGTYFYLSQALPCHTAHVCLVGFQHHRCKRVVYLWTFMLVIHDCFAKECHHAFRRPVHDSSSSVRDLMTS